MIPLGFAILLIPFLFFAWRTLITIWRKLTSLGLEHNFTSVLLFDTILRSLFYGFIVSRITWMVINFNNYEGLPWSFLPFEEIEEATIWFSYLPWRFFSFVEGLYFPAMWGVTAVVASITLLFPTIKVIRTLNLEKRGIVRGLLLKTLWGISLIFIYFAILTAYSYYLTTK